MSRTPDAVTARDGARSADGAKPPGSLASSASRTPLAATGAAAERSEHFKQRTDDGPQPSGEVAPRCAAHRRHSGGST
ncbi:MAG: hypothetical protein QM733_05830 [Ilumatobacteraceae bacterium]